MDELSDYLMRSQAALKRHRRRLAPILAEVATATGLDAVDELELVLFALGDESTQRQLKAYWQEGGVHPVVDMGEEDVRTLDRQIAQAIVLAATTDPEVRVREKRPGGPRRR